MSSLSKLITDGYVVAKKALPLSFIKRMGGLIDANIAHLEKVLPEITHLFDTNKEFQELLKALVDDPALLVPQCSGIAIKEPGHKSHQWHTDWGGWGDPRAKEATPPGIGFFIYLEATSEKNAALRVVPRSHTHWYEPVHKGKNYGAEAKEAVIVHSKPGDAVLIDVRILHGTCSNSSKKKRVMVLRRYTIWDDIAIEDRISWPRKENML